MPLLSPVKAISFIINPERIAESILHFISTIWDMVDATIMEEKAKAQIPLIILEDWQWDILKKNYEAFIERLRHDGIAETTIQEMVWKIDIHNTGTSFKFSPSHTMTLAHSDDSQVMNWERYQKWEAIMSVEDMIEILKLIPWESKHKFLFIKCILGMEHSNYWMLWDDGNKYGNCFHLYGKTERVVKRNQKTPRKTSSKTRDMSDDLWEAEQLAIEDAQAPQEDEVPVYTTRYYLTQSTCYKPSLNGVRRKL